MPNAEIARRLGVSDDTVRVWRRRWDGDAGLKSLDDKHRTGRPATVKASTRAKLVSIACERPDENDRRPFRDVWSYASLQKELERQTGVLLSVSEIGRILRQEEIRPHRVRMWLHSQDPDFGPKIDVICELYTNPLPEQTVLCVDEKRLFAHRRSSALQPAAKGKMGRYEFVYSRHGSSVMMTAFNIGNGEVLAHCNETRTGDDLVVFMEKVAAQYAGPVTIIWDNLNVHSDGKDKRWTEFNERHGGRFNFVYTPKHASWTNQVEIWFSILERRIMKHGSFKDVPDVVESALGFVRYWNTFEMHPFNWTFRGTRDMRKRAKGTRCQKPNKRTSKASSNNSMTRD